MAVHNCKYCKAECGFCGENRQSDCGGYIPMTNADRIRAMSDEELAEWMAECNAYKENADASQWLPWLKQPVEEDNG